MVTAGKRHGRRFRSSHLLHLRSGLTSPPVLSPLCSRSAGTVVCRPLAPHPVPAESGSASSCLAAQGKKAGIETVRRQGTRAPQSPRAGTPALGTPQPPPRGGRPHLCSLDSAFPGWVPRLAESRGSWRSSRHLETSCGFLSAQSLSFPLSRPPGVRFHPLPRQGSARGPCQAP